MVFTKGYIPWNKGKKDEYSVNVGSKHPRWKGGRKINSLGYVCIYEPNHPNCRSDGYVLEHRLVMEKHIGRYLERKEVVHHINQNKMDNKIENLELLASINKHSLFKGIKTTCPNCGESFKPAHG